MSSRDSASTPTSQQLVLAARRRGGDERAYAIFALGFVYGFMTVGRIV